MAKLSLPAVKSPRPLTSPGGIVQSGGYLGAASIDRLSRPGYPIQPLNAGTAPKKL